MHTILFVCTGNTCRSPMAEAVAQHWFAQGLLDDGERYLAASAGVAAAGSAQPSPETVRALRDLGISHSGRSKPLTAAMIRKARAVLCMTAAHAATARELAGDDPDQRAKVFMVDPAGDVEDPIGHGQEAYDALARRFMELIPRRLEEVLAHEDRAGVGPSRG